MREDGTLIIPDDNPKIINQLATLWKLQDPRKVAEGVLSSELIWGDEGDLNEIPGLTDLLTKYLSEM